MDLVKRSWYVVLLTLFVGAGTSVAQSRVQLQQGKRTIQDKVSFVVDIAADKRLNPQTAGAAPYDLKVWMRFADRPASGKVYLDGKAVGRFDESMQYFSNSIETTYGRHTITVAVTAPAALYDLYVDVRGAVAHEILEDEEPVVTLPPNLSTRVTDLERKVQALEAELAGLKKKRNH